MVRVNHWVRVQRAHGAEECGQLPIAASELSSQPGLKQSVPDACPPLLSHTRTSVPIQAAPVSFSIFQTKLAVRHLQSTSSVTGTLLGPGARDEQLVLTVSRGQSGNQINIRVTCAKGRELGGPGAQGTCQLGDLRWMLSEVLT